MGVNPDWPLWGWGGGREEGRRPCTDLIPRQKLCRISSASVRGNIFSGGFSPALIPPDGRCFLRVQPSILTCERETRGLQHLLHPDSHGDLRLARWPKHVENGDRGPAASPSAALDPDFIHSRKCVSIYLFFL